MIGMDFRALLILIVAALIAAGVVHYVIRYRFLDGFDGFVGKCIAGWVGAWLGVCPRKAIFNQESITYRWF